MKFVINSITIEGFKGFTYRKKIQVSGKHLFIFGPNGFGKSSIIEALRWCLFGLTGRPEEIVRNQFYGTGDCYVEVELAELNGGSWKVQRKFSLGSGQSRQTILDPQGKERTRSEVFPFLTSLGPKEGTYIVFGGPSQFPSRARPLESIEISDFSKTIYTYLRLEDVPNLIEKLSNVIKDQKVEEERLAKAIDEEKRRVTEELEEIERRLSSILRDPPWSDPEPPTSSQTKDKIKELLNQLGKLRDKESPKDLNEAQLLDLAQSWVQDLTAPKEDELNKNISKIREKESNIRGLKVKLVEKKQAIEGIKRQITEIESRCQVLLGNNDINKLRKELENLNEKITYTDLLTDIRKKAISYLENHDVQVCFICSAKVTREKLKGNIVQQLEQVEPNKLAITERRDELEILLKEVTQLDVELERLKQSLQQYQKECNEIETLLCSILNLKSVDLTLEKIESFINSLDTQVTDIEQTLKVKQEYRRSWERKIERLREERRYQGYRNNKEKLETLLEIGLKPVQDSFNDLVEFRESLEEIRKVLISELKEVIKSVLPFINEMMSEVYGHLTNQASFDQIQIKLEEQDRGFSPKLLVQVASKDETDLPPFDPERVLNGQALSALRLVPYFVFSRFQRDTWGTRFTFT
ncbi:MAG: AAA family ATPase [Candidatus Jordarchaeum sp.]|uniref:AAA family ATPase n=1 Tax=Candidatus Jordarchaeum sp. TaxID=2823881 RepID=UPI00404A3F96